MQVVNALFYGLPWTSCRHFRERVNASPSTTSSASRRHYLKPDRLSVVLVGNASAFVDSCRRSASARSSGFRSPISIWIADARASRRRATAAARPLTARSAARSRRAGVDRRRARVMISCGEASGDLYAGALVDALQRARSRDRGVRASAASGCAPPAPSWSATTAASPSPACAKPAGVLAASLADARRARDAARERRPDVFVAIDFPDFNFRLAAGRCARSACRSSTTSARRCGRGGRAASRRSAIRRPMLVIFPFEEEIYERAGVPVEFVGHPLIDLRTRAPAARGVPRARTDSTRSRPILAILPGSRPSELRRSCRRWRRPSPLIASRVPAVQFLVARAPALDRRALRAARSVRAGRAADRRRSARPTTCWRRATRCVTASGTATVQAALHDTPMVIVYRLSAADLPRRAARSCASTLRHGEPDRRAGRSCPS